MPPPRKVDLLPEEIRRWLNDALKKAGFGDYVRITDDLNAMLEEKGLDLRIGKSAVHAHGKEYADFVELQREASTWAKDLAGEGVQGEAELHALLVQQLMTHAFNLLKGGAAFTPKDLESFGKTFSSIMSSSTSRERILEKERERIRDEERQAAAKDAETVAVELGLNAARAKELRLKLAGVAT